MYLVLLRKQMEKFQKEKKKINNQLHAKVSFSMRKVTDAKIDIVMPNSDLCNAKTMH